MHTHTPQREQKQKQNEMKEAMRKGWGGAKKGTNKCVCGPYKAREFPIPEALPHFTDEYAERQQRAQSHQELVRGPG